VQLIFYGSLPDACTTLGESSLRQVERSFAVTLTSRRQPAGDCPARQEPYEHTLTIDADGLPAGEYTLIVNGASATFRIDAQATATPTPTPTEPAAELDESAPQVMEEPPEDPGPTPAPATLDPAAPTVAAQEVVGGNQACLDKAAFYGDVTVPDGAAFRQGDSFVKTWRLRNEGTCAWSDGYSLAFAGGDLLNAPLNNPIPAAEPGQIIEVSLDMAAPTGGGKYTSSWELQNDAGKRFGVGITGNDLIWVQIVVNWINPDPSAPSVSCAGERIEAFEQEVLSLINNARLAANLEPLSLNSSLSAAAFAHSQDMACQNFVSHTGSDGSNWRARIAAQGYEASTSSENIYAGSPEFGGAPQGAFTWWMNSQIHHDNILDPDRTDIGVGYAFLASSEYGGYYTLVFARP
jgi:uncharacterized protein YkwD